MSVKLPGPLFFFFFFLMGFVFCDSYYSTGALCTRFTLVCLKVKSKNLGEGSKPLLQLRARNDGNKPLLLSCVCKGWVARDSPLLVAPGVAIPFCLSPPLFVVHVLFHSSTHTKLKTPTKTK